MDEKVDILQTVFPVVREVSDTVFEALRVEPGTKMHHHVPAPESVIDDSNKRARAAARLAQALEEARS